VEFLVEFELNVPKGSNESEVTSRNQAEASAAATLASDGHLVRVWKLPVESGENKTLLGSTGRRASTS
jgi:muconolactone D-isomerase